MSDPYLQLRDIIKGGRTITGIVVRVEERTVHVTTAEGMKACTNSTVVQLKQGDKVHIRGDAVVSRLRGDDEVPHYIV